MTTATRLARALGRRGQRIRADHLPPRPDGPLVWIHCPLSARHAAARQLALRLIHQEDTACSVLLTVPDSAGHPPSEPADNGPFHLITAHVPPDDPVIAEEFFEHWSPDAVIWMSGYLQPDLLARAQWASTPCLLAEAEQEAFDDRRWRLRSSHERRLLAQFSLCLASTGNAARRLQRLGVPAERIEVTGHLQEGGSALPCRSEDREELAEALVGRPVWLAAMVKRPELDILLEAQRGTSRLAHRLLMILVPDDPEEADTWAAHLAQAGWRFKRWSDGDLPRDETQILLADTRGDMGLWYRLAPVTFMAGSLMPGMHGHDPFEPAALGSAIIHGPHVATYRTAYSRLAQAGATRTAHDAQGVQKALSRLLAPDQAASLANAAWQITTDGAEMTDRTIAWVTDRLDEKGLI